MTDRLLRVVVALLEVVVVVLSCVAFVVGVAFVLQVVVGHFLSFPFPMRY